MGRGRVAAPLKLEKDRGREVLKRVRKRVEELARKWNKIDYQLQVHAWSSRKVDSISENDLAILNASRRAVGIEIRFILKWLATNSLLKGPKWDKLDGDNDEQEEGIDVEQVGCVVCGRGESTDENDILLCDRAGCFCAFHMECCDPPVKMDEVGGEDDPWFCRACDCLDQCLEILRDVLDDPGILTWENVFPELADAELPSDMDENKLLHQNGDLTLECEESDDEDFNPLEEEYDEEKEDNDGENSSCCNKTGKYVHVLFFHPDELESNGFRNGVQQHGRQDNNSDNVIKGYHGMQHQRSTFREGIEMSEKNGGRPAAVEQFMCVEGQNNDVQKGLSPRLFQAQAATASSSDSDSSMIVDPSEVVREIDELSDGLSEDDPARHNRKRRRLASRSSKVDNSDNGLKNCNLSGVENVGRPVCRVKCGVLQFGKVVDFSNQKWTCEFGKAPGEKIVEMEMDEFRAALQLWEKEGKKHMLEEQSSESGAAADSDNQSGEEVISEDNIISGTRPRKPVDYVQLNNALFGGGEYILGVDDVEDFDYGRS